MRRETSISHQQALRRLLDAAVRFEARAARQSRIETERRALQEAITEAQLVLSVGGQEPKATDDSDFSSETVMEAGAPLRGLPGGKATRGQRRQMPKKKRPKEDASSV